MSAPTYVAWFKRSGRRAWRVVAHTPTETGAWAAAERQTHGQLGETMVLPRGELPPGLTAEGEPRKGKSCIHRRR